MPEPAVKIEGKLLDWQAACQSGVELLEATGELRASPAGGEVRFDLVAIG